VELELGADVPTDVSVCAATIVPDVIEAAEEIAVAFPIATEEGASEAGGIADEAEDAGTPPPVDEFDTIEAVESVAGPASDEDGIAEEGATEGATETTTEVERAAETASAEDGSADEATAEVMTTEVTGAEVTTAADAETIGADVAGAELAAAEVTTATTDEGLALDAATAVADAWPLGVMGELKSALPCGSGRTNPDGKRLPFAPL
jgi:hypothetical protein